jgi:thiosulfate/3-mercaptopyruvate sulfurtransferase
VGPVITADELAALLAGADADVVVADVRWRFGEGPQRDAFAAGHIPGAVFVDLDADLARAPAPGEGRHPLPDPDVFVERMAALGIGEGTVTVACDDSGGSTAARLWWMLTVLGHPAAVLDGGIHAWAGVLEPGPGSPARAATPLPTRPWPAASIALLDEIEAIAAGTSSITLLDARAAARYRAEVDIDPRPGHIPGAISAEFAGNLDVDGRLRPPAVLAARYAALHADRGDVVVSCGSGVTACHDALAMVRAGLPMPRVYVGSYSEWIADPDRRVAT